MFPKFNVQLAGLDLRKMNLDEIIHVLTEVGKSLATLTDIWRQQLEFFMEVKGNARVLKSMSDMYANIGRSKMNFVGGRQFMMEALIIQAREIQEKSFLVYTMAKIYAQVSRNHILVPLSRVNHMFFESSVDGVTTLRDELAAKVETTKEAIKQLLTQEQASFKRESDLQKERYNHLL